MWAWDVRRILRSFADVGQKPSQPVIPHLGNAISGTVGKIINVGTLGSSHAQCAAFESVIIRPLSEQILASIITIAQHTQSYNPLARNKWHYGNTHCNPNHMRRARTRHSRDRDPCAPPSEGIKPGSRSSPRGGGGTKLAGAGGDSASIAVPVRRQGGMPEPRLEHERPPPTYFSIYMAA
ncbi:hypothetical protein DFH09DRAFT_1101749 [Mycena vulgaris]|nr:hypothetical protein DFH09DRAFT_1101749 [Mycena vulgaris]